MKTLALLIILTINAILWVALMVVGVPLYLIHKVFNGRR